MDDTPRVISVTSAPTSGRSQDPLETGIEDALRVDRSRERPSGNNDDEIGDVSDTAFLAAGWRAMESSRSDGLFRDPLAADLAGERGLRIAQTLPDGAWVVAIRTVAIDAFVRSAISSGIDTIIDVGAGLDTRPYRMDLPSSVRWFEIDHPAVIDRKDAQL